MGGGGGKTPEPTKFTPPPLQDGPATNPIPNWFAQAAGSPPRADPFQALANIPVAQAQNPFGAPPQTMTMPIVQQIARMAAQVPQQQTQAQQTQAPAPTGPLTKDDWISLLSKPIEKDEYRSAISRQLGKGGGR